MDGGIINAACPLGILLEMVKAIRLVLAGREDVKRDLAANQVSARQVTLAALPASLC